TVRGRKSLSFGFGAMTAVLRITVSPYLATMAPLACFAIFPVSKISALPPISTDDWKGAGMWLSAMIYPLSPALRDFPKNKCSNPMPCAKGKGPEDDSDTQR